MAAFWAAEPSRSWAVVTVIARMGSYWGSGVGVGVGSTVTTTSSVSMTTGSLGMAF